MIFYELLNLAFPTNIFFVIVDLGLFGFILLFEIGSHYAAQVGLKLMTPQPQFSKRWDYRNVPHTQSL
jgi:hypothetical protein